MAHLLIVTTGLTGIVHASLEVVRRLEAAGHRVTYACPHDVEPKVRPYVESYVQLGAVAMNPAPMVPREGATGERRSRLGHKWTEWTTRGERRRQGVPALGMDAFAARLAELAPDAVLLDVELYEHAFTARREGFPVALLCPWFQYAKRAGLPPISSGAIPGEGWAGSSAGMSAAWVGYRARRAARIFSVWARYFGTDRRGVVREYARSLGVERRTLWPYDWITLFSMAGFPIWSMTAAELDFEHPSPEHWSYVGPMVRLDRATEDVAAAARLDAAAKEARRRGNRILYASGSSKSSGDLEFLGRLVEAGELLTGWTVLLGMGGDARAAEALRLRLRAAGTSDVEVFDWAPQLHALSLADVALHHAGIHSVHEALELGVSTVTYSGGNFDQDGCAARLAAKGLSVVGSKAADTPDQIAGRVREAADDPGLQAGIKAMKSRFDAYRTGAVLDELVAGLLSSGTEP